MEFHENSWVIAVGGGILSGLAVAMLTRFLFSRKDNREHMQKVAAANREVVYALRPGISEGEIPSEEVLASLVNATARKHRVLASDVFTPRQIAEELVKDIMDSNFISAEAKQKYCETLAHLVHKEDVRDAETIGVQRDNVVAREYRQKLVMHMSGMLGITVALMTMTAALMVGLEGDGDVLGWPFSELDSVLLTTMAAILGVSMSMLVAMLALRVKTLRDLDGGGLSRKDEKNEVEAKGP